MRPGGRSRRSEPFSHTAFIPDTAESRPPAVDDAIVARVLIGDPYPEIRELLVHIVGSMGHEPVVPEELDGNGLGHLDVVIFEPGSSAMLDLAREARRARPEVQCVCLSIYPPDDDALALGPVDYFLKPFSLAALQRAIGYAAERSAAPV